MPSLFAHLLEEARRHATAKHRVHHHESRATGSVAASPATPSRMLACSIGRRTMVSGEPRSMRSRFGSRRLTGAAATPEVPVGGFERRDHPAHELIVIDRPGHRDDQILRTVVSSIVRDDGVADDRTDRGRAAPDGSTERMLAEHRLEEPLAHDIGRIVVGHRELFEDDPALGLEIVGDR